MARDSGESELTLRNSVLCVWWDWKEGVLISQQHFQGILTKCDTRAVNAIENRFETIQFLIRKLVYYANVKLPVSLSLRWRKHGIWALI